MGQHFAFVSAPAPGHVNPTLPLVEELVRRGHRVSYATGPDTAQGVRAAGADVVALTSALPPDMTSRGEFTAEQLAVTLEFFLDDARTTYPELVAHFEQDRPDVICYDSVTFTGRMLAAKLAVPEVALVPTFAENEHFSARQVYLPESFDHTQPRLLAAIGQMGEFAKGHKFLDDPQLMFGHVPPVNVVFIPRQFQLSGDTFDDRFEFVGPSLSAGQVREEWHPTDPQAPVLLVSLGTVFNQRPEFYRDCVAAFDGTGWQVVMAVGDLDPADLGPVPANFEVRRRVPQVAVLRHATVFLTHAGMNSVMESLYHGVPVVAVPQIPEQQVVARRVAELGLGEVLGEPGSLRETVERVAADERVRREVTAMSAVFRASGGAVAGADALEKVLARHGV